MIVTLILLIVIYAVAIYTLTQARAVRKENLWNTYTQVSEEGVGRILQPVARLFYGTKPTHNLSKAGRFNESLRRDLEFTGLFGASLEVYFAVQVSALLVGMTVAALSYLLDGSTERMLLLLPGLGIMLWPWSKVRTKAKERRETILKELPEFADILLMYMEALSVVQACRQAAGKTNGVVSLEMRELVLALTTRTMSEGAAFDRCAARLGTLEGKQFVSALQSAVIDGTGAARSVRSQVESLREIRYQKQRADVKKLSTSLIVLFGVHFLPLIFILAGIPVIAAFAGIN